MQFSSFLHSACPPITQLVHPHSMAHSIALMFFLPPLLFLWRASCNWQRTPSHVSFHCLSLYNMFFILAPQWGHLIPGYGMWLSVMRLLDGCLCLNQSGGLTSAHSVWWPCYAGLCIFLLSQSLPYGAEFSSIRCHRYYLCNSHIHLSLHCSSKCGFQTSFVRFGVQQ